MSIALRADGKPAKTNFAPRRWANGGAGTAKGGAVSVGTEAVSGALGRRIGVGSTCM